MTLSGKYWNDQEGVAATEFALVAPVLFILAVGMFNIAMFANTLMQLGITARAAAQYVLNGGDTSGIENDVILPSSLGVTASNESKVSVTTNFVCLCNDGTTVDCSGSCTAKGYMRKYVDITLGMTYKTPYHVPWLSTSYPLTGHARLQME